MTRGIPPANTPGRAAGAETARCACGALTVSPAAPPLLVALCHCYACQRRTGAPFSANAFYLKADVEIVGRSTMFVRTADSGREVRMHFCPGCGSTLYWHADASPSWVGLAVGGFSNRSFPPPSLSVFEQARHAWVTLDEAVSRFNGLPGADPQSAL